MSDSLPPSLGLKPNSLLPASLMVSGVPYPSMVLEGDSVECLKQVPDEHFQLTVTSPPYDDLRSYQSGGKLDWDFKETARQLYRTTCVGGVVCWVVNDSTVKGAESLTSARQKIFFVDECGFQVHDTMIYQKPNFSNPSKGRYHQVFEYVFVLSKGKPRCFNPIMDRRNISAGKDGSMGANTCTQSDGSKVVRKRRVVSEFGMRHNIWKGNTRGQEEMCQKLKHPAMMPKWLARDLILSFSDVGDLVADCFAGSGTTGIQALKYGRRSWLCDKSSEYSKSLRTTIQSHETLSLY